MTDTLLRLAAFGAPAMLGVLSAVVGRKSVQSLREQTGDDSALTRILSGAVFLRAK